MGGKVSIEAALEGVDFGTEIDDFQVKYVGSVPVKAANGNDIVKNAVERLRSLKLKERPVMLKVTTVGIYVIDAATADIIKEVNIQHVSFVSQDSVDESLVSFFENVASLRLITCHTFRISKDPHLIPVAINEAFKALKGEKVEQKKGIRRKSTSKKDALRASTARKVTVEKGDLVQEYPGGLYGTVNVSKPKGDDVIDEAVERIMNLGHKLVRCKVQVHSKAFCLVDEKFGGDMQVYNIRDVSFAKMIAGDTPVLAYIIHDRRLDRMSCTAVALDDLAEGQPSVRRSIDQVQKAIIADLKKQKEAAAAKAIMDGQDPSKVAKKQEVVQTDTVIGVFESTYLGSVVVSEQKGNEVVDEAVELVLKQKTVPVGVFVHVGTEGLKVYESLTHEVVHAFVLKDISFTTVTGRKRNMFAYIQKDESLNLINCHIFTCAGERAFDIATAIGEAFKAFAEQQKKSGGNPFKPFGERETPPQQFYKTQVHRVDLLPIKAIGAGQFGQVFLAKQAVAAGEGDDGGDHCVRAVKMLRGGASAADKQEFMAEAEVMLDLQHENLVQMIGVAVQQRPWLMVLEFLKYGDLRNVLRGCRVRGIEMTYAEQLKVASQVARGMEHIASLRLVHMDLAARNVLVTTNNLVKVADFGLTRKLPEGQDYWQSQVVMKLPVKWCSIEALDDRVFSEGSDVWAFGVVLWEIANYGTTPYENLKTQEVQRKVRDGVRLPKPANCPDEYFAIAMSCWQPNRHDRPKFAHIASELGAYLRTQSHETVRDLGVLLKSA
eukprot:m.250470 g.250470  ORF g.250470 m.250470 type:complete len:775 (+) comp15437_c0_seq1:47-2371(+)